MRRDFGAFRAQGPAAMEAPVSVGGMWAMRQAAVRRIWMCTLAAAGTLACPVAGRPLFAQEAQDLCGRAREAPDALFQRLTKTEKLRESFRDKSYITINDEGAGTIWTFTVAGHPAHPSVVCRDPVEEGGKLRIDMGIQCEASEAQCEELAQGFEALNRKMLKELERQGKKS
jgi:hypothetical protein